jgi:hypothetical protein
MKKKFKNKSTCVPPHACQKGVLCYVHDVDEDEFEGFSNKKKKSVRREVDVERLQKELEQASTAQSLRDAVG